MIKRIVVLSDIHANLTALKAVISDFESRYIIDGIALLGDIVNYGMRPNETLKLVEELTSRYPVICNLWGNHEKAVIDGDTTNFSTARGAAILEFTRSCLDEGSIKFLLEQMDQEGFKEFGHNVLFVHASLTDPFWGKLQFEQECRYDYVISGHSHVRHLIEKFYPCENPVMRNKKRTIFLNPGSVGQPRNHNPKAQYLYIDFENEKFEFNSVEYDILSEQEFYQGEVDEFYKIRLTNGV